MPPRPKRIATQARRGEAQRQVAECEREALECMRQAESRERGTARAAKEGAAMQAMLRSRRTLAEAVLAGESVFIDEHVVLMPCAMWGGRHTNSDKLVAAVVEEVDSSDPSDVTRYRFWLRAA